MKVLLFGADTETGIEMLAQCEAGKIDCVPIDSRKVDLGSTRRVMRLARRHQPDFLVNLIDYEPLDNSASEQERASDINCDGVHTLAKVCRSREIPLLHLSTDAIFGDGGDGPFVETSDPSPTDAYGESHFQGEQRISQETHRYIILRTGWIIGARENGFLQSLLNALRSSRSVGLDVERQFSPTSASDVARVLIAIIRQLDCGVSAWGVYHYSSADITTWYGFGEQVLASARFMLALRGDEVVPSGEESHSLLVPERAVTQLSCRKILYTFGIKQRPWDQEMDRIVKSCAEKLQPEPASEMAETGSESAD